MDPISQSAAGSPVSPASRPAGAAGAGTAALTSDFETFLRLLTTQLENQDPLNPIESADFAVQLATFSGVEQQVRTNELLAAQAGRLSSADSFDAATWIGREARVSGPVRFDGAPIELYPPPPEAGRSDTLVVRDGRGAVIARAPIPPGATVIDWAGTDGAGAPLPAGAYEITVESLDDDGAMTTRPVDHYEVVTEVEVTSDGPRLLLASGEVYDVGDVSAVRAASERE